MGRVEGKVAFITGVARGQGRSHAIRLAEEGADIIGVDICEQIPTAGHSFGTEEEMAETVALVEQLGRRMIAKKVDVRDHAGMTAFVVDAVGELGRLDVVCANAGMGSIGQVLDVTPQAWADVIDVTLTGVFNTAQAAIPHIIGGDRGGSVILISSTAGLLADANLGPYNAAKHGVIGLMKTLALELAPQSIRVNAVCPSGVDTPMLVNDALLKLFLPHLDSPTREDAAAPGSPHRALNALPVPWVDPVDISNAVLYLASDEARYVTGISMPVDAGRLLK